MKRSKTVLALAAVAMVALVASSANAAMLTYVSQTPLGGHFGISVTPGSSKYIPEAGASGAFGDGTALDWFIPTGANGDNPYQGGSITNGGLTYIAVPTCNAVVYSPQNWASIWVTGDPDVDAADLGPTGTVPMIGSYVAPVIGTIDISTLSSGSFYHMFGSYNGSALTTMTMSGPGQTDITDTHSTAFSGNVAGVEEYTFDNTGLLYDTITYTCASSSNDGRRRYVGVVLDGVVVPEPATMGLLAIGGLALLKRRQRRS